MGGAPAAIQRTAAGRRARHDASRAIAYNPPVDTVSEVKVETFQADAAYGNTGGGTVNVVSKGGTNSFHGTAYEFNQVSQARRHAVLHQPRRPEEDR